MLRPAFRYHRTRTPTSSRRRRSSMLLRDACCVSRAGGGGGGGAGGGPRVSPSGTPLRSRRDQPHKVSRLRNAFDARHHHMTSTPLEESATSKPIAYPRLALTVMLALYAIPLMRHPEAGSFLD